MRKRPVRHNVKNCLLSFLLSVIMIGSLLPSSVFAEEGEKSEEAGVTEISGSQEITEPDSSVESVSALGEAEDTEALAVGAGETLPSGTVINITYSDSHGNSEPKLFGGYVLKHVSEEDFACDVDGVEVASVVWEKSTDGQTWEDCGEDERVNGKYYYCLYITFESSMTFPFTTKFTCTGFSSVKAVTATPQDKEARLIMDPVGSIYPEARIDDIYYEKLTDALTDAEEGDTVVVIAEQYPGSVYSETGKSENAVHIDKDITIHNGITLDLNNKYVDLDTVNTLTIDLANEEDGSSSEVPLNGTIADDRAFTIVNTADGEKAGGLYIQGTIEVCSGSQLNYSGLEPQKAGGIKTDTTIGSIGLEKDSLVIVPKDQQDADTIRTFAERYPTMLNAADGAYASFDDPADTDPKDRKLYIYVNSDPANVDPVWARVVDRIDVVYSGEAFELTGYGNLPALSSDDFKVSGTDALSVQSVVWQKETELADSYYWLDESPEGDSPVKIVNDSKYRLAVTLSEEDAPVCYRNFNEGAFDREIYDEERCSLTTGTEGESSGIGQSKTGFRILNYQSQTEACTPVLYAYFDLKDTSIVQVQSRLKGTDTSVADVSGGGIIVNSIGTELSAPELSGYKFLGWYTDYDPSSDEIGNLLTPDRNYKYMPSGDITLTAVYSRTGYRLTVSAPAFRVTYTEDGKEVVQEGQKSGIYYISQGTDVTVEYTADTGTDADEKFLFWGDAMKYIVSEQTSFTFTMLMDSTLTAYTAPKKSSALKTVRLYYISLDNQIMDCYDHSEGEDLIAASIPIRSGSTFLRWDKDAEDISAYLAEDNEYPYLIIRPEYKQSDPKYYTICIRYMTQDGIRLREDETLSSLVGQQRHLNAFSQLQGSSFCCWKWQQSDTEEPVLLSISTLYKALFYKDVTLLAVYGSPEKEDVTANVQITGTTAGVETDEKTGVQYSYIDVGLHSVIPSDSKILGTVLDTDGTQADQYGTIGALLTSNGSLGSSENLIMHTDTAASGIGIRSGYLQEQSQNYVLHLRIANANNKGKVYYVRGFIIYTDSSGTAHTLYTDVIEVCYNTIINQINQ